MVASLLIVGCSLNGDDDPTATSNPASPTAEQTAIPDAENSPTGEPITPEQTPAVEPTGTATEPPEATASETPAEEAATTTPGEPDGSDIGQQISQIKIDTSELRGLEFLEDVEVQILDQEQLRANLEELLAEEYSQEDADRDTLTLWLLNLIDEPDLDLYQLQLDLLTEQVLGYYDQETKELVVVSDDQDLSAADKVTTSHELVHSLQDQHFDLTALDEATDDVDQETALTALIEGDATLAMTIYATEYMSPEDLLEYFFDAGLTDTSILDEAPRYISEALAFPYVEGMVFVEALYADDGFASVDAAFADPPTSTEQILHPEKYIEERDEPVAVDLPDLSASLGDGWEMTDSDVLGEWDLWFMLDENGASDARQASAGWGGSRYELYQSEDQAVIAIDTRWDTAGDAAEFEEAVRETLQSGEQDGDVWEISGRYVMTAAAGDSVLMVTGTDQAAVRSAMEALVNS
jgi:hypothetical protein